MSVMEKATNCTS